MIEFKKSGIVMQEMTPPIQDQYTEKIEWVHLIIFS